MRRLSNLRVERTAMDQPLLYTLEQVADQLHVGRTTVFKLLRDGDLPSMTIGRRRLVPAAGLVRYIERQVDTAASSAA